MVLYTFDLTGYILGPALLFYACYSKRFKGRYTSTRWVLIVVGIIAIAGTLTQNIIEFQDH
jgi:hypothetical protein